MPESAPRQVTTGIEMIRAVSCADGKTLAYTKGRTVRNVFRAPLPSDRPATWTDTSQLTFDEADIESVDVSRDGRLIVTSDRSGNWDVWTLSTSGGSLEQLTTDPAIDAGPRWKSDGSEVVFYSTRTGHRQIWVVPIGGGPARQLTHGEEERFYPAWSPNGLEIVVRRRGGLSVVPAVGGEERQLASEATGLSDWSPDGKWVAFSSNFDGANRPAPDPITTASASIASPGRGVRTASGLIAGASDAGVAYPLSARQGVSSMP